MMPKSTTNLDELNSAEFQALIADLLTAEGYVIQNVLHPQSGLDMIAVKEGEGTRIAVEVKHTKNFTNNTMRSAFNQLQANSYGLRDIWCITSAESALAIPTIPGYRLKFSTRKDVLGWVAKQQAHHSTQFLKAARREFLAKAAVIVGVFGILAALVGMYQNSIHNKAPLSQRIENVSSAIENLSGLEKQLAEIKTEMADTERARQAIEKDYAKAKELEKFTTVQLENVREALQQRSLSQAVKDNMWGFVLGVASSIVATVIINRYNHYRELRSDD